MMDRPYARCEGGDHTILVGEVEPMTSRVGESLVFCRGSYRALAQRTAC
jgi:hypothetical protein